MRRVFQKVTSCKMIGITIFLHTVAEHQFLFKKFRIWIFGATIEISQKLSVFFQNWIFEPKNWGLPQCVLCKVTQYNYTFFNCDFVEKKCRFGSSKKSGRINQYATLFSKGVSSARLQWVELGWNVLRALLPLWDILLPFFKETSLYYVPYYTIKYRPIIKTPRHHKHNIKKFQNYKRAKWDFLRDFFWN